jgi:hypothetical protein
MFCDSNFRLIPSRQVGSKATPGFWGKTRTLMPPAREIPKYPGLPTADPCTWVAEREDSEVLHALREVQYMGSTLN